MKRLIPGLDLNSCLFSFHVEMPGKKGKKGKKPTNQPTKKTTKGSTKSKGRRLDSKKKVFVDPETKKKMQGRFAQNTITDEEQKNLQKKRRKRSLEVLTGKSDKTGVKWKNRTEELRRQHAKLSSFFGQKAEGHAWSHVATKTKKKTEGRGQGVTYRVITTKSDEKYSDKDTQKLWEDLGKIMELNYIAGSSAKTAQGYIDKLDAIQTALERNVAEVKNKKQEDKQKSSAKMFVGSGVIKKGQQEQQEQKETKSTKKYEGRKKEENIVIPSNGKEGGGTNPPSKRKTPPPRPTSEKPNSRRKRLFSKKKVMPSSQEKPGKKSSESLLKKLGSPLRKKKGEKQQGSQPSKKSYKSYEKESEKIIGQITGVLEDIKKIESDAGGYEKMKKNLLHDEQGKRLLYGAGLDKKTLENVFEYKPENKKMEFEKFKEAIKKVSFDTKLNELKLVKVTTRTGKEERIEELNRILKEAKEVKGICEEIVKREKKRKEIEKKRKKTLGEYKKLQEKIEVREGDLLWEGGKKSSVKHSLTEGIKRFGKSLLNENWDTVFKENLYIDTHAPNIIEDVKKSMDEAAGRKRKEKKKKKEEVQKQEEEKKKAQEREKKETGEAIKLLEGEITEKFAKLVMEEYVKKSGQEKGKEVIIKSLNRQKEKKNNKRKEILNRIHTMRTILGGKEIKRKEAGGEKTTLFNKLKEEDVIPAIRALYNEIFPLTGENEKNHYYNRLPSTHRIKKGGETLHHAVHELKGCLKSWERNIEKKKVRTEVKKKMVAEIAKAVKEGRKLAAEKKAAAEESKKKAEKKKSKKQSTKVIAGAFNVKSIFKKKKSEEEIKIPIKIDLSGLGTLKMSVGGFYYPAKKEKKKKSKKSKKKSRSKVEASESREVVELFFDKNKSFDLRNLGIKLPDAEEVIEEKSEKKDKKEAPVKEKIVISLEKVHEILPGLGEKLRTKKRKEGKRKGRGSFDIVVEQKKKEEQGKKEEYLEEINKALNAMWNKGDTSQLLLDSGFEYAKIVFDDVKNVEFKYFDEKAKFLKDFPDDLKGILFLTSYTLEDNKADWLKVDEKLKHEKEQKKRKELKLKMKEVIDFCAALIREKYPEYTDNKGLEGVVKLAKSNEDIPAKSEAMRTILNGTRDKWRKSTLSERLYNPTEVKKVEDDEGSLIELYNDIVLIGTGAYPVGDSVLKKSEAPQAIIDKILGLKAKYLKKKKKKKKSVPIKKEFKLTEEQIKKLDSIINTALEIAAMRNPGLKEGIGIKKTPLIEQKSLIIKSRKNYSNRLLLCKKVLESESIDPFGAEIPDTEENIKAGLKELAEKILGKGAGSKTIKSYLSAGINVDNLKLFDEGIKEVLEAEKKKKLAEKPLPTKGATSGGGGKKKDTDGKKEKEKEKEKEDKSSKRPGGGRGFKDTSGGGASGGSGSGGGRDGGKKKKTPEKTPKKKLKELSEKQKEVKKFIEDVLSGLKKSKDMWENDSDFVLSLNSLINEKKTAKELGGFMVEKGVKVENILGIIYPKNFLEENGAKKYINNDSFKRFPIKNGVVNLVELGNRIFTKTDKNFEGKDWTFRKKSGETKEGKFYNSPYLQASSIGEHDGIINNIIQDINDEFDPSSDKEEKEIKAFAGNFVKGELWKTEINIDYINPELRGYIAGIVSKLEKVKKEEVVEEVVEERGVGIVDETRVVEEGVGGAEELFDEFDKEKEDTDEEESEGEWSDSETEDESEGEESGSETEGETEGESEGEWSDSETESEWSDSETESETDSDSETEVEEIVKDLIDTRPKKGVSPKEEEKALVITDEVVKNFVHFIQGKFRNYIESKASEGLYEKITLGKSDSKRLSSMRKALNAAKNHDQPVKEELKTGGINTEEETARALYKEIHGVLYPNWIVKEKKGKKDITSLLGEYERGEKERTKKLKKEIEEMKKEEEEAEELWGELESKKADVKDIKLFNIKYGENAFQKWMGENEWSLEALSEKTRKELKESNKKMTEEEKERMLKEAEKLRRGVDTKSKKETEKERMEKMKKDILKLFDPKNKGNALRRFIIREDVAGEPEKREESELINTLLKNDVKSQKAVLNAMGKIRDAQKVVKSLHNRIQKLFVENGRKTEWMRKILNLKRTLVTSSEFGVLNKFGFDKISSDLPREIKKKEDELLTKELNKIKDYDTGQLIERYNELRSLAETIAKKKKMSKSEKQTFREIVGEMGEVTRKEDVLTTRKMKRVEKVLKNYNYCVDEIAEKRLSWKNEKTKWEEKEEIIQLFKDRKKKELLGLVNNWSPENNKKFKKLEAEWKKSAGLLKDEDYFCELQNKNEKQLKSGLEETYVQRKGAKKKEQETEKGNLLKTYGQLMDNLGEKLKSKEEETVEVQKRYENAVEATKKRLLEKRKKEIEEKIFKDVFKKEEKGLFKKKSLKKKLREENDKLVNISVKIKDELSEDKEDKSDMTITISQELSSSEKKEKKKIEVEFELELMKQYCYGLVEELNREIESIYSKSEKPQQIHFLELAKLIFSEKKAVKLASNWGEKHGKERFGELFDAIEKKIRKGDLKVLASVEKSLPSIIDGISFREVTTPDRTVADLNEKKGVKSKSTSSDIFKTDIELKVEVTNVLGGLVEDYVMAFNENKKLSEKGLKLGSEEAFESRDLTALEGEKEKDVKEQKRAFGVLEKLRKLNHMLKIKEISKKEEGEKEGGEVEVIEIEEKKDEKEKVLKEKKKKEKLTKLESINEDIKKEVKGLNTKIGFGEESLGFKVVTKFSGKLSLPGLLGEKNTNLQSLASDFRTWINAKEEEKAGAKEQLVETLKEITGKTYTKEVVVGESTKRERATDEEALPDLGNLLDASKKDKNLRTLRALLIGTGIVATLPVTVPLGLGVLGVGAVGALGAGAVGLATSPITVPTGLILASYYKKKIKEEIKKWKENNREKEGDGKWKALDELEKLVDGLPAIKPDSKEEKIVKEQLIGQYLTGYMKFIDLRRRYESQKNKLTTDVKQGILELKYHEMSGLSLEKVEKKLAAIEEIIKIEKKKQSIDERKKYIEEKEYLGDDYIKLKNARDKLDKEAKRVEKVSGLISGAFKEESVIKKYHNLLLNIGENLLKEEESKSLDYQKWGENEIRTLLGNVVLNFEEEETKKLREIIFNKKISVGKAQKRLWERREKWLKMMAIESGLDNVMDGGRAIKVSEEEKKTLKKDLEKLKKEFRVRYEELKMEKKKEERRRVLLTEAIRIQDALTVEVERIKKSKGKESSEYKDAEKNIASIQSVCFKLKEEKDLSKKEERELDRLGRMAKYAENMKKVEGWKKEINKLLDELENQYEGMDPDSVKEFLESFKESVSKSKDGRGIATNFAPSSENGKIIRRIFSVSKYKSKTEDIKKAVDEIKRDGVVYNSHMRCFNAYQDFVNQVTTEWFPNEVREKLWDNEVSRLSKMGPEELRKRYIKLKSLTEFYRRSKKEQNKNLVRKGMLEKLLKEVRNDWKKAEEGVSKNRLESIKDVALGYLRNKQGNSDLIQRYREGIKGTKSLIILKRLLKNVRGEKLLTKEEFKALNEYIDKEIERQENEKQFKILVKELRETLKKAVSKALKGCEFMGPKERIEEAVVEFCLKKAIDDSIKEEDQIKEIKEWIEEYSGYVEKGAITETAKENKYEGFMAMSQVVDSDNFRYCKMVVNGATREMDKRSPENIAIETMALKELRKDPVKLLERQGIQEKVYYQNLAKKRREISEELKIAESEYDKKSGEKKKEKEKEKEGLTKVYEERIGSLHNKVNDLEVELGEFSRNWGKDIKFTPEEEGILDEDKRRVEAFIEKATSKEKSPEYKKLRLVTEILGEYGKIFDEGMHDELKEKFEEEGSFEDEKKLSKEEIEEIEEKKQQSLEDKAREMRNFSVKELETELREVVNKGMRVSWHHNNLEEKERYLGEIKYCLEDIAEKYIGNMSLGGEKELMDSFINTQMQALQDLSNKELGTKLRELVRVKENIECSGNIEGKEKRQELDQKAEEIREVIEEWSLEEWKRKLLEAIKERRRELGNKKGKDTEKKNKLHLLSGTIMQAKSLQEIYRRFVNLSGTKEDVALYFKGEEGERGKIKKQAKAIFGEELIEMSEQIRTEANHRRNYLRDICVLPGKHKDEYGEEKWIKENLATEVYDLELGHMRETKYDVRSEEALKKEWKELEDKVKTSNEKTLKKIVEKLIQSKERIKEFDECMRLIGEVKDLKKIYTTKSDHALLSEAEKLRAKAKSGNRKTVDKITKKLKKRKEELEEKAGFVKEVLDVYGKFVQSGVRATFTGFLIREEYLKKLVKEKEKVFSKYSLDVLKRHKKDREKRKGFKIKNSMQADILKTLGVGVPKDKEGASKFKELLIDKAKIDKINKVLDNYQDILKIINERKINVNSLNFQCNDDGGVLSINGVSVEEIKEELKRRLLDKKVGEENFENRIKHLKDISKLMEKEKKEGLDGLLKREAVLISRMMLEIRKGLGKKEPLQPKSKKVFVTGREEETPLEQIPLKPQSKELVDQYLAIIKEVLDKDDVIKEIYEKGYIPGFLLSVKEGEEMSLTAFKQKHREGEVLYEFKKMLLSYIGKDASDFLRKGSKEFGKHVREAYELISQKTQGIYDDEDLEGKIKKKLKEFENIVLGHVRDFKKLQDMVIIKRKTDIKKLRKVEEPRLKVTETKEIMLDLEDDEEESEEEGEEEEFKSLLKDQNKKKKRKRSRKKPGEKEGGRKESRIPVEKREKVKVTSEEKIKKAVAKIFAKIKEERGDEKYEGVNFTDLEKRVRKAVEREASLGGKSIDDYLRQEGGVREIVKNEAEEMVRELRSGRRSSDKSGRRRPDQRRAPETGGHKYNLEYMQEVATVNSLNELKAKLTQSGNPNKSENEKILGGIRILQDGKTRVFDLVCPVGTKNATLVAADEKKPSDFYAKVTDSSGNTYYHKERMEFKKEGGKIVISSSVLLDTNPKNIREAKKEACAAVMDRKDGVLKITAKFDRLKEKGMSVLTGLCTDEDGGLVFIKTDKNGKQNIIKRINGVERLLRSNTEKKSVIKRATEHVNHKRVQLNDSGRARSMEEFLASKLGVSAGRDGGRRGR